MPHLKRKLSSETGSITVITAIVVSTLIALGSMSQTLTTMLSEGQVQKAFGTKVGKRANGGTLELSSTLLNSGTITFVAWKDRIEWRTTADPSRTFWKGQQSGAFDYLVTIDSCNPRHYDGKTQEAIFSAKSLPQFNACRSAELAEDTSLRTVNAVLDLQRPSNNGIWNPAGGNYVPSSGTSKVAQGGVGPPKAPVADDARINLSLPPPPACTIQIITPADKRIVTGQTVQYVVTSSYNAYTAATGNYPAPTIAQTSRLPAGEFLLNDTVAQTGSIRLDLANPLIQNLTFPVTATMIGPGGTATCTDWAKVYPVPKCLIEPRPPEVTIGQSTILHMTTSNNWAPANNQSQILSATLNGSPVTVNGGDPVVTPPQGATVYTGRVQGINNYPVQTCQATVLSYAYPQCSLQASPGAVYIGNASTLMLRTNYTGGTNTSLNRNQSSRIIEGNNVIANFGGSGGNKAYGTSWTPAYQTHVFYGQVTGINGGGDPAAPKCSAVLQAVPPPYCRFLIPGYYEHYATPWGMSYLGINLYHPEGSIFQSDPPGVGTFVNGDFHYYGAGETGTMGHTAGVAAGFYHIYYTLFRPTNNYFCQVITEFRDHGCFTPETRVRAGNGDWLRADEVRKGMTLWNPKKMRPMVVTKVVAGPEKIPMIEIGYGDYRVHVTTQHAVPTADGVKQAIELTKRDRILGADMEYHSLEVLRRLPVKRNQQVWNFETAGDKNDPMNFVVDSEGIVTGNLTLQLQLLTKTSRRLP